jgi:colicin import membrane protein
MNKTTISGIFLAVAVLATGCHKTDDTAMGPAQQAGKAVDDAGATVAQNAREGAERADQAAERAGDKIDHAAKRAGDNLEQAGAEVRQESKEAAHDMKEDAKDATAATGKSIERAGERIQDASK